MSAHLAATSDPPISSEPTDPRAPCLNCGARLAGAYCATCGQHAVDLAAPTWHAVKEAVTDAIDLDGRVLRTAPALCAPGRLTTEYLSGHRVPYVSPIKLFLLAGTVLTTTWIVTRGIDAHYYGLAPYASSAGGYIDRVVRGTVAAAIVITVSSWLLSGGRRRVLDHAVFAIHLVAALTLWFAAVVWLGTAWKLLWGTAAATPRALPSLLYVLFLPAIVVALGYIVLSIRRVDGGCWWLTPLRALLITSAGTAAVVEVIRHAA